MEGLLAHRGAQLVGRQELLALPTPEATDTHKPVPHALVVQALVEALGLRRLSVVSDEYALTPDAMRLFGVLAIDVEESDVRFAIGIRNSHDKTFSLALTVGYRVLVCDNLAFHGDFTPVTRKHSKHLDHIEVIDAAVGRMQRHFEPMRRQIDAWRNHSLPDNTARLVIYQAFIEGGLHAPRHLARIVHDRYFHPEHPKFEPRTAWSLSNAFTSAFTTLPPITRFQVTARLGAFLGDLP